MDIHVAYNVIPGELTFNANNAVMVLYLLLVQFEWMTERWKIMQRPKDGKGMLLYESEILMQAPRRRDASIKQDRKKMATEEMVVLSVLVEERGRPRLESTSEVVHVQDVSYLEWTVQIDKELDPTISDGS